MSFNNVKIIVSVEDSLVRFVVEPYDFAIRSSVLANPKSFVFYIYFDFTLSFNT